LHHAKSVATHPKQKTLLPLSPDVNAGVKEGTQQSAVAEQNAEQLVVINVDVMKPGCVKQIVSVNENGYTATMPKLPGRACSRIELHFDVPQTTRILRLFTEQAGDQGDEDELKTNAKYADCINYRNYGAQKSV
jgi:hypothetical protein